MLLARGDRVRLLGRSFAAAGEQIEAGAVPLAVDLRDEVGVRRACAGVEVVYHAGALSAAWGNRTDFFTTNVGGTRAVIAGCREYGARRLIYVSSPSVVFNGKDQHNVSEAVPYPRRFASVYSLTKKLGEELVRQAAGEMETVILRPKAIFGPGDRTLLPQLIAAARQGRLPQIGSGENLVDLTYVENVSHALLLACDAANAVGGTYTITNDEHVPLWQVIRHVLKELGLPSRLRHLPLPVVLSAATLMEARAVLTREPPLLTRYSAAILARTQTYDISAAKRDLAYAPLLSVEEGIRRTLRALKEER